MNTLWQDLRYGARMLIKQPGFTVIAVLTLALQLLTAQCLAFAQPKETLVPMRDGVRLALDLYFPSGPSSGLPVILERTPYNKAIFGQKAKFWTSRGYAYAIQDVRGRFRSEGRFEPFLREGPDGFDTIEWLARQPWCSGKVGTIGMSYDGLVQWQAAVERPPHLAAMVVSCATSDRRPYDQGVLEFMPIMRWLYLIRGQKPEDSSPWTALESFPSAAFWDAFEDLPVAGLDLKVFGHVDEIWRKWCSEGPESNYWKPARYLSKVDGVTVPVLHQSGWFDGNSFGTKLNYLAMIKAGAKNQRLIMGPWGHTSIASREARGRDFGAAALLDLEQEYADWFAHWLKGAPAPGGESVKLFVMGENRWMTAKGYPLPGKPKRYFLGSEFALLPDRGDSRQESDQYVYDPGDPTPSPHLLGDEMESRYGELLRERKDIVVYRSAPIQEPFKILGPMSAVIYVSSDVPETDLVVRRAHLRRGSFARALHPGGGHIAGPVPGEEACSGRSGFIAYGDPDREGQSFGGRHRLRVVSGVCAQLEYRRKQLDHHGSSQSKSYIASERGVSVVR